MVTTKEITKKYIVKKSLNKLKYYIRKYPCNAKESN